MSLGRRICAGLVLAVAVAACAASARPVRPPVTPETVLARIAFGSCSDETKPIPLLRDAVARRPDLFLYIGDNVYGDMDSGDETLPELRESYAALAANEDFRVLRANVPILAAWDDHDYGRDDAGGDFPAKRTSQKLFLDFWGAPPQDVRRRREGVYDSHVFGPPGRRVQVIILDTRYFRSPLRPSDEPGAPGKELWIADPDPAKTMLGAVQWAWLVEQLRRPAELRLVISSVQVLADRNGFEGWHALPWEREHLFALLRRTGAGGVVFLSGDRHRAALYRREGLVPYPLYELTASSLNIPLRDTREEGDSIGPMYNRTNYGLIDIDWSARSLALRIVGQDGSFVRERAIAFDEIQAGTP